MNWQKIVHSSVIKAFPTMLYSSTVVLHVVIVRVKCLAFLHSILRQVKLLPIFYLHKFIIVHIEGIEVYLMSIYLELHLLV